MSGRSLFAGIDVTNDVGANIGPFAYMIRRGYPGFPGFRFGVEKLSSSHRCI